MKDDKLLQRFLDDQSKTMDASQPASPHQNETTPSTNDARVANGGRGHQTISHTKSITFTPSMFGYDDIDAESSVSQDNPDRKPLRAPSRDTPAANAPTGQSNSERQVPRSFLAAPPPLTSPAKATGATLEQVRDQVREHRTERKREQKARLLGRPVSKGGKRATADAEDKQGAAAAKSRGGILRDKVIDKKRKQAPGSKPSTKENTYHETLIHDATVAGKSRLTLPKGIFDRVKTGAKVGDLDFSKVNPPPAPSPTPARARTSSNHVDSSRSSQIGAKTSSVYPSEAPVGSSRATRSPPPPSRIPGPRTSSPPRVLSIHESPLVSRPVNTSSPHMRTGFATARVQTGPTLLGIPSQYHPDRYSLSPEQDDAALPPSPAFQFFDIRHSSIHHDNSQLPTVNDPLAGHVNDDDMDAEDKDDVLSELKYLARQVPDYGRRHSSTRPDTRDRSSIHLVGDPTLIMEGGSEIDYGFTDEQVMLDTSQDPDHTLPAWAPNPVSAFASAKRPFFHNPHQHHENPHHYHPPPTAPLLVASPTVDRQQQSFHGTIPPHASGRPATSQSHWARASPVTTLVVPVSTRFGSVQPSSLQRRTSRGWSHV